MTTSGALELKLRPSRSLFVAIAGLHLATLLPLLWSALPAWAGVAVVLILAAHGVWVVRRCALLRSRRAVTALSLTAGGDCSLALHDGSTVIGRIDPATVVLGWLVVVAVRHRKFGPASYVPITSDMLGNDDFRRLRVGLKWSVTQRSDVGHA